MRVSEYRFQISSSLSRAAMILVLFTPIAIFFSRQSPSLLIAIIALMMMLSAYLGGRWSSYISSLKNILKSEWFIFLALFFLYACISSVWSPAGTKGLIAVIQTGSSVVSAILLVLAFDDTDSSLVGKIALTGLMLSALTIIADTFSLHEMRVFFIPDGKAYDSNRAAVLLSLATPILLGLIAAKGRRAIIAMAALVIIVLAVSMSFSESAKLALMVSVSTFVLISIGGKKGWLLLLALFILLHASAPLTFNWVHDLTPKVLFELTEYKTFEIRTKIWETYSQLVSLKPLAGFGAGSAEHVHLDTAIQAMVGTNIPFLKSIHPHSAPLQIWFELGLIGALLAGLSMYFGLRKINLIEDALRSTVGSFVGAVYAVSAISHGLWQAWWPCVVAYVCLGIIPLRHKK